MKNFFQRQTTEDYKTSYVPAISTKMNIGNLDNLSKQEVLSLYSPQQAQNFLAYRFEMLSHWMKKNKTYSKEYVIALQNMIDKLYLFNELNSFEQQYVKNVEAVVFAKNRNLKQLIVDFSLDKSEMVFYRYSINAFKQIDDKGNARIINDAEMYITTKRIIIAKNIDIISIYYSTLKSYQYLQFKFLLNLKNGVKCYIDTDNNREKVESLSRVLKREKIKFN